MSYFLKVINPLFVSEGNKVLVVPLGMTNGDIREALHSLAQVITTHVNRGVEPKVNDIESIL